MTEWIRVRSRRDILVLLLALGAGGGAACLPQVEQVQRVDISVEALDRIDAAVEELAEGRWASWSMEVAGGRLSFQVDLAETAPADACSGIGAAVREVRDDIPWSADLTRSGRPLSSCGSVGQVARTAGAARADARS